jgi:hypothetical protein
MEAADPFSKETRVSERGTWLGKQVGLYEVLSLAAVLSGGKS